MGKADVMRTRRRRAFCLVGVPLVVVALWNPVIEIVGPEDDAVPQVSGWDVASELLSVDSLDGDEGSGFDSSLAPGLREKEEVPEWLEREVLPLAGDVWDIRANNAWSVVSFLCDDAPEDALAHFTEEALLRGWQIAESGVAGAVTGTKGEGRCRWMAMSCTVVGETTCIVVQLPGA